MHTHTHTHTHNPRNTTRGGFVLVSWPLSPAQMAQMALLAQEKLDWNQYVPVSASVTTSLRLVPTIFPQSFNCPMIVTLHSRLSMVAIQHLIVHVSVCVCVCVCLRVWMVKKQEYRVWEQLVCCYKRMLIPTGVASPPIHWPILYC